jgi:hypothetical protein
MRWVGHVAFMGKERKLYKGKLEGKKLLGRPRREWEKGIRMEFREMGRWVWSEFSWFWIETGGGLM